MPRSSSPRPLLICGGVPSAEPNLKSPLDCVFTVLGGPWATGGFGMITPPQPHTQGGGQQMRISPCNSRCTSKLLLGARS